MRNMVATLLTYPMKSEICDKDQSLKDEIQTRMMVDKVHQLQSPSSCQVLYPNLGTTGKNCFYFPIRIGHAQNAVEQNQIPRCKALEYRSAIFIIGCKTLQLLIHDNHILNRCPYLLHIPVMDDAVLIRPIGIYLCLPYS